MGSIGERYDANAQLTTIWAQDGGFPNDYVFSTFVSRCRDAGSRVAFHEPDNGLCASFDQFVTDIVHQRHHLRRILLPHIDETGILKEGFTICILSTANYEFSVAALAILALGGLIVPLRKFSYRCVF